MVHSDTRSVQIRVLIFKVLIRNLLLALLNDQVTFCNSADCLAGGLVDNTAQVVECLFEQVSILIACFTQFDVLFCQQGEHLHYAGSADDTTHIRILCLIRQTVAGNLGVIILRFHNPIHIGVVVGLDGGIRVKRHDPLVDQEPEIFLRQFCSIVTLTVNNVVVPNSVGRRPVVFFRQCDIINCQLNGNIVCNTVQGQCTGTGIEAGSLIHGDVGIDPETLVLPCINGIIVQLLITGQRHQTIGIETVVSIVVVGLGNFNVPLSKYLEIGSSEHIAVFVFQVSDGKIIAYHIVAGRNHQLDGLNIIPDTIHTQCGITLFHLIFVLQILHKVLCVIAIPQFHGTLRTGCRSITRRCCCRRIRSIIFTSRKHAKHKHNDKNERHRFSCSFVHSFLLVFA